MSCFPSVQRKAQDCIDGLLSGERLPNFHDRESLPYVQAVFLEILRYAWLAPVLASSHRSCLDGAPRHQLVWLFTNFRSRWFDVFSIALPHRSLTNDSYRGYLIPAGSAVIPNSWCAYPLYSYNELSLKFSFSIHRACLHDEDDYPNPMEFSPERFLTPDGLRLRDDVMDPRHLVFGYGRRFFLSFMMSLSHVNRN